jgi:dihydropteroate synthase
MGIVNVTPDSFSDGGKFDSVEAAVEQGLQMEKEGAQILDIGGESTRPGAAPVCAAEEMTRVIPVIAELSAARRPGTLISVDTSKAMVAEAALDAGADIVNDVAGLRGDAEMLPLLAERECGIVIMHMKGEPQTMQASVAYENVVAEVRAFFEERMAACEAVGIDRERICFDPGIGFGKTLEHNLELLRNLAVLRVGGRPLLLGASRKSFIGKLVGSDALADRSWPTVALTSFAREQGVEIVRVHEARLNVEAMRMTEAILYGAEGV